MRIVTVAFLAAVILHFPAPMIVSAIADLLPEGWPEKLSSKWYWVHAAGPVINTIASEPSSPFHAEQFVYISPPAQKATDPRFYSDAFEFVPNNDGKSGGSLVQPIYGAIPLSALKHSATTASLQPSKAVLTPPPVKYEPALADSIVDGQIDPQISTAPQIVTPPVSEMSGSAKGTVTPTVTTVASAPASTPMPTPVISGQLVNADDIEEPQFYRGSYVFDPETRTLKPGVIDGPPSIAGKSPGKTDSDSSPSCADCASSEASKSTTAFPRAGRAMYYNPGIMETVLSFRLQAGHVTQCGNCVGYAALLSAEDLNRKVWIEWGDGAIEGPFLVIDAAAKHHVTSLMQRNWVIDIDYATAMRHGMNQPVAVTVWDHRPGSAYKPGGK